MFRKHFAPSHRRPAPRLFRKLMLEALEDRLTPSGYSLTELALPPGTEQNVVREINSTGQVVGNFSLISGELFGAHAFLYNNGQSTDLGTLPGDTTSIGFGINTSGQVVGRSISVGNNGTIAHAFLYSNGQMTELNGLDGADAINDSGQIVGTGTPPSTSSGTEQAALYSNGTVTYLGSLNSVTNSSTPTGINASGQIVGVSDSSTSDNGSANTKHAFLYSGGKMIDLGTLPGDTGSGASDINSSGQVVGASYSFSDAVSHAFLYSDGQMTDLGALPGDTWTGAGGINSSGQIVGASGVLNIDGSTTSHAFLYSDGQMTDLNSLLPAGTSVTLTAAIDINDNGQILAKDLNGNPYLLTPQTTTETVISNGAVSPSTLTASNSGQQVAVSATVNTNGSPATTGNVAFSLVDSNGAVVSDGPTGGAIGTNGQASDTLTVPGGTVAGSYSLQVAYTDDNQTTTQTFTGALNVIPPATAPGITGNPSDQSVTAGQTATFTAAATGNPTPTIQWQTSTDGGTTWANINLPSSATITVPNVTLAANGAEFRAVFTNSAGSATTSPATLTVTASPPSSVSPVTPPAPTTPPSIPDQIQQLVQDLVQMGQSLSSGDMAAFGQELQDYVSLVVSVEMEIFQIVLNEFAELLSP